MLGTVLLLGTRRSQAKTVRVSKPLGVPLQAAAPSRARVAKSGQEPLRQRLPT